ncbi:Ntr-type phosphotransferase system IIA domain protein [Ignavibacterium album JCM 16511]|uniref:Ntr-type phosphotransferase system IIA domain protein n=1 Tax=Ignavibacterium album (strain DSM 19864 / JCM 16511 / NBRC 101810 / Mat9-16) TaxID=945713 RepID=I0AHX7_IGNAJ|nr:PTS sugar transporter subunit IIA [Ignavibacterium album]AFH48584.1 Ntr-type phosphotransferase system IIA domain protein [Ignavibacterium album JCM 16511]
MKISEILSKEFIIAELESTDKESAINELIDLFKNDPRVEDIEKVRYAVLERENIMSTGVGKGFAIPHGKTDSVKEILAAFGRKKEGIDYDALDGNPVNLIFLLVGKETMISAHIKLLSRISRMMNKDDFRIRIMNAETSEEIMNVFLEEEKSYLEI